MMKAAPFAYHAPETVDDVAGLLAAHGDEAKILAGGQSLIPLLALRLARFGHLVDVNRVPELSGVTSENGWVRVAAGTRHRVMERDATVAGRVPLLTRATPLVGHFQIRNRGTVGGALAHADPAAEYPAVALALEASLEVRGPSGPREIPAAEFFVGTWTTSLEPDELLVAARFPTWEGRCGFAVEELARRHGDFAIVGAVCGVRVDEAGVVDKAALGFFGVGATPIRAGDAEAALIGRLGRVTAVDLAEIARLATRELAPSDDLHATGEYRRELASVLTERALTRALSEATDG
jgi:carbon-monoxide dehydrogenase medium subunit